MDADAATYVNGQQISDTVILQHVSFPLLLRRSSDVIVNDAFQNCTERVWLTSATMLVSFATHLLYSLDCSHNDFQWLETNISWGTVKPDLIAIVKLPRK